MFNNLSVFDIDLISQEYSHSFGDSVAWLLLFEIITVVVHVGNFKILKKSKFLLF